jgi:hypothetical protein
MIFKSIELTDAQRNLAELGIFYIYIDASKSLDVYNVII